MSEEDKLTQLDANFARRRRELVERDEFPSVRPFQCEFELQQELFVDVAHERWSARRGGRFGGYGDVASRDGLRCSCGALRIVEAAHAHADQEAGGGGDADPPRRRVRARAPRR